MSKLYTEDQVKIMLVRAKIFDGQVGDDFIFIYSEKDVLQYHSPIELPTDEDIEKEFTNTNQIFVDRIFGAKWVLNKIKGGEK